MNLPRQRQNQPVSIKTPQELVHIKHKITLRQYKYWVLALKSYREAYEAGVQPDESGFFSMPMRQIEDHLGYKPNKVELRADMEALRKEQINKVSLIAFTKNDIGNAFWNKIGWTEREDLNYYDFTLNEKNITAFIEED